MCDRDGNEIRLHKDGIVTVQKGDALEHITDFRFCRFDENGKLIVWETLGAVCTLEWLLVDQRRLSEGTR
jgi:hypothetical protein